LKKEYPKKYSTALFAVKHRVLRSKREEGIRIFSQWGFALVGMILIFTGAKLRCFISSKGRTAVLTCRYCISALAHSIDFDCDVPSCYNKLKFLSAKARNKTK